MKKNSFLIVGAGFSGAVLANQLVKFLDCNVRVIDERDHIAGNCYTVRDSKTNIMIHTYGPHIFNTDRKDVWDYMNSIGEIKPYLNRVKAVNTIGVFSMPINLHTINQFFDKTLSPKQAEEFLTFLGDKTIVEPQNFEEQALKLLGEELYQSFFYGYTKKQWGCEPKELPASILKRLPIRFNYDDNYYSTKYQGIPVNGYAAIVERLLDNSRIIVDCGLSFDGNMINEYDHVFYTGPIDKFFNYSAGRLGYRTVYFEREDGIGDYQGNAVINYVDMNVPYTRVHEHKHFTPWEKHEKTTYFFEYSKETETNDTPYYPKRLAKDMEVFKIYQDMALHTEGVSFIGRLGTYRYLNMDQAIGESLDFSLKVVKAIDTNHKIPTFNDI